jgi:hypothetical protein
MKCRHLRKVVFYKFLKRVVAILRLDLLYDALLRVPDKLYVDINVSYFQDPQGAQPTFGLHFPCKKMLHPEV